MIADAFNRVMELQALYSARKNSNMDERGVLVTKEIPRWLDSNIAVLNTDANISDLAFDGQHQMGYNSRVPYIRLFSREKSPRAPIGWYCVFLFDETGESVYLTLGHGSTDPYTDGRHIRTESEMRELVSWGLSKFPAISSIDIRLVPNIDLKGEPRSLGKAYEKTTLFAYKYDKNQFPDDAQLILDIRKMLSLLASLYSAEETDPTLPGAITPESEMAEEAISLAAGRRFYRRRYGGARLTGAESDAIEDWAVVRATEYLYSQGWTTVEDVGATESYDLHCQRTDEMMYVEVKGTQSHGEKVVLTRNEVNLHRLEYPHNALIVVKRIVLLKGENPSASGGEIVCITPWTIEDSDLEAMGFNYTVPNV